MPFTVSDILATQDRAVRIVSDETGGFRLANEDEEPLITATYRIGAYTPRYEEEMRTRIAAAPENDTAWIVPLLLPLLASWDVETDDHKPYPITEEGLRDLPLALLYGVLACINKDAEVPKGSTKPSSAGTGSTTGSRATSAKSRRGSTRSTGPSVRRVS